MWLTRLAESLAPTDASAGQFWTPLPGPQTWAFASDSDEIGYGGAGGGGKTDLLLGLALEKHRKAVIFRREYKEILTLVERSRELLGDCGRFNGQDMVWRLPGGKLLEFGGVQHPDDVRKWRGRDHDLKAFDEAAEFTEQMYLFLTAWARTTVPGQKVQIVATFNPPTSAEGEWVLRRWAPWLQAGHPDPAEPGELRWFAMLDHGDGRGPVDTECGNGEPFDWQGETIAPTSRTFFPARLDDNPYLARGSYRARLQAMPEPLRSQLLYGDFTVGLEDHPWQVIPSAWVQAAQARWRADGRPTTKDGKPWPLDWTGVDVAEGGDDRTVLARRYRHWIASLEVHPGKSVSETPDAKPNAALVERALAEGGGATIDADGLGSATYHLVRAKVGARVVPFKGSAPTELRDRSGVLTFANLRAYAWWRMREWLDPNSGRNLALPPGPRLLAELTSARWMSQTRGVQIEPKEQIKQRLGRSPDEAEAVILSLMVQATGGPTEIVLNWGLGG